MKPDDLHFGLTTEQVKEVLRREARTDLHAFMRRMHRVIMPGHDFVETLHLRALSWKLEQVLSGKSRRLLVGLPPRWFKSNAASIAFPAYALGHDPSLRLLCGSYGLDLGRTFAEPCRDILTSNLYRELFPNTHLKSKAPAWDLLSTTAKGYRRTVSVGGPVTGKGADIGIVDDPMKADEAASLVTRESVHQWFQGTFMSRFEKRTDARIIVLMQRLHMDDLIGRLLNDGGWDYLCMPAQADRHLSFELAHEKSWEVKPNEFLFPARHGPEDHVLARRDMGEAAFNAQIQQAPSPPGGAMIKLNWFNRYEIAPARSQVERVYQMWDTAMVDSGTADYSVGLTFAVSGKRLYLIDVLRRQMAYPELEKAVIAYRQKHQADAVMVEQAGTGIVLIQNLRMLHGFDWMIGTPAKPGKMERAASQAPKLERGRVYLPRAASWLNCFQAEVAEFPFGRFDDQVDALTHFLRALDFGDSAIFRELSMYGGWQPGEPVL